jgi:hypothetical protein
MNRIESLNGYTIFQAGARDVKKYNFSEGGFYVYFSSDIRELGIANSTPEYEDCGTIEEARAHCSGNYALAKEVVEGRTTAASAEEILEVEAQLDAGLERDDIETAYERMERPANLPADIPWSDRPYDPDDPLDPYTFDGSMTPEDYELMHRNIAAAKRLGLPTEPSVLRERLAEILEAVVAALYEMRSAVRTALAVISRKYVHKRRTSKGGTSPP